jgi:hypothetical protein
MQPILSNQFWILIRDMFGEKCADALIERLSFDEDWEEFKSSDFYLLNSDHIEEAVFGYFLDSSKVEDVKKAVAKFWLNKINSQEIKLI